MPLKMTHKESVLNCVFLVLICAGFSLPGIYHRAIWYDEAVTLLETAGHATPQWPIQPTPCKSAKRQFTGVPSLKRIADELKESDIHPPLYYWALVKWRQLFGFSIETARIFSLVSHTGGVLILYFLLLSAGFHRPLIPSLMYAISYSATHFGGEARAYAFTTMLILWGVYFAYLSVQPSEEKGRNGSFAAVAMSILLGMAFLSNYLSLFPIAVVFAWFLYNKAIGQKFSKSKYLMIYPMITFLIILPWIPTFISHLGKRPHQAAGFIGYGQEIYKILFMNIFNYIALEPNNFRSIFHETINAFAYKGISFSLLGILIFSTSIYLVRNFNRIDKRLFALLLALAIASSFGLFFMDKLFNKNLSAIRYLFFGLFPSVVLLYYGISQMRSKIALGIILTMGFAIHACGNSWVSENPKYHFGSNWRTLANHVKARSTSSKMVAIFSGYGRGTPASVIYELPNDILVMVISENSDRDKVLKTIASFDEVCFAFSIEHPNYRTFQLGFVRSLINSGGWKIWDQSRNYICMKAASQWAH